MPTIADYTIILDNVVTLPDSIGDVDRDFTFNAPAVNAGVASILAFRVNPDADDVTLRVTLNGTNILTQRFNGEPQERSWHEVIGQNILQDSNNTLTLARIAGSGVVRVSDLVLFFQTNV